MFCRYPGNPGNWKQFRSRMTVPPKHVTVFLGAGASVAVGCPLMRDFIDWAADFARRGVLSGTDETDAATAIATYEGIRRGFTVTEEDVENIENVLSLADLAKKTGFAGLAILNEPGLPDTLRRFIDTVVNRSISVPAPHSHEWMAIHGSGALHFRDLVSALAKCGEQSTVVTTNYDCVVEYACHCMGLPFTYNRAWGRGVEILKLHGSSNWIRCGDEACPRNSNPWISPMQFIPDSTNNWVGHLQRTVKDCPRCGKAAIPVIVPPTWAKDVGAPVLTETWSRAAEVLASSEAFLAIGYSLPEGDAHLRHLLHLGLSSGNLRQALAVVGSDESSAARWNQLFRSSWRDVRLDVHMTTFASAMNIAIEQALVVPKPTDEERHFSRLLPISFGLDDVSRKRAAIAASAAKIDPNTPVAGVDWHSVSEGMRAGKACPDSVLVYRKVLEAAGLDHVATDTFMSSHTASSKLPNA